MMEKYLDIIYRPSMTLFSQSGEFIGGPFSIKEGMDNLPTPVSRPKLVGALYDYAIALGISVTFGKKVVDYYEDLQEFRAGAITDEGERFEADLVLAADGVGSLSWKAVSGEANIPKSSGYSVYRVAFATERALQDPLVKATFPLKDDGDDICHLYLGKNTHGIILVNSEITTWMLTHRVRFPVNSTTTSHLF
jgi:2-polyprenyl-6-methoxyphenol hydroxylase-like FAD-dependent oxidoreductase